MPGKPASIMEQPEENQQNQANSHRSGEGVDGVVHFGFLMFGACFHGSENNVSFNYASAIFMHTILNSFLPERHISLN